MANVQDLANSIAQMEGYNTPGTIANRLNNPGNLRYAPNQVGTVSTASGNFAQFATAQDGWDALNNYIEGKAATGVSLRDFIYTYAPPSENSTSSYLNYLSSQIGLNADSSLSSLVSGSGGGLDVSGIVGDNSSNTSDILGNLLGDSQQNGIDPLTMGLIGAVVVGVIYGLSS